ncbi:hypothetical protein [Vitreimonas flagellata]|uniref:hypothetical protein n=1 Tax=Vitreimonas flagellata TaxID=2560861 RepID=UPI001074BAF1|nr:hypothetical protein [Vitreimonas flagellata]
MGGLLAGLAAFGIYLRDVSRVDLIFGRGMDIDDAFFASAILIPVVLLAGMSAVFAVLCLGAAFWFTRHLVAQPRT